MWKKEIVDCGFDLQEESEGRNEEWETVGERPSRRPQKVTFPLSYSISCFDLTFSSLFGC